MNERWVKVGTSVFAVLQVEKQEKTGIIQRALHKLNRRNFFMEQARTPFGTYTLLKARSPQFNWDKAASLLGRAGRFAVLPRGLQPPPGSTIQRFEPRALVLAVLRNTAVELVRQAKLPLYSKAVTLIDMEGEYTAFVRELIYYCMTVKVVTAAAQQYQALAQELMEELGAGIVVSESFSLCDDSILIVAPDSGQAQQLVTRAPVLTAGEIGRQAACFLVGEMEICLPTELAALVPKGIAPMDFAGALYQFWGWKGGEVLTAHTLRCKNNLLKPQEITQYMERVLKNKNKINRYKTTQT